MCVCVCACVCMCVCVRVCVCVCACVCVRELAHTYQLPAIRPVYYPTSHQVDVRQRNGRRDNCGQVQLPCSRACFLTLAPTPAICGSFALLQIQHCCRNGTIASPLFAAPVSAPLLNGDAARQQVLPPLAATTPAGLACQPTHQLTNSLQGVNSVTANAPGYCTLH